MTTNSKTISLAIGSVMGRLEGMTEEELRLEVEEYYDTDMAKALSYAWTNHQSTEEVDKPPHF